MHRMKCGIVLALLTVLTVGVASAVYAKTLRLPKTGARCADDTRCHNRWHPGIKPVTTADPGDVLIYETRDALDHAFTMNSTAADVPAANLNLAWIPTLGKRLNTTTV